MQVPFIKMNACKYCGSKGIERYSDSHALCRARTLKGLPTPALGDACSNCQGSGMIVSGPNWQNLHALAACTKTCNVCNGTGKA